MNPLKRIRSSMNARGPDAGSTEPSSTDADQPLTAHYEGLNERDAVAELGGLNQIELTVIDTFERSHRDREPVLNKLRYLRQPEPLPGYDALEQGEIAEALSGADSDTIKDVREYERKLQNRPAVNKEITRALHRLRDGEQQPLVVGNGLPVRTKPTTG